MDENLFDDMEIDAEDHMNEDELNDGTRWLRAELDE